MSFFLHCSGLYFPTGDLAIEETLVTCEKEADVCFGKVAEVVFPRKVFLFFSQVVLTVSNSSSSSVGVIQVTKGHGLIAYLLPRLNPFLQVTKGCGVNASLAEIYNDATLDVERQCFVSKISNSSKTLVDLGSLPLSSNGSVLSGPSEEGTLTWSQEELCFCKGSQCNQGRSISLALALLILPGLVLLIFA